MFIKGVIIILLILIILSLGAAMFSMIQDRGQTKRTVKYLTLRIGLSVALFILLIIAFSTGLIQPHGLVPH